jgi:DNA-binding transcriptional LysR family regulator
MNALEALEHRLLRSFIVVAEELHFGRAAARLHLSQPPLSMQIRKLEDRLGVRLLERDRRRVALTEAGRFLLERARGLLAEAGRSFEETGRIGRGESGVLAIGYTPTATYEVLPPLIREFRRDAPDIRLELVEMRSALQPEALRAGRIEVGFACGPVEGPGARTHVLRSERFVAALPRSHRLARASVLRVRDLDGQPFIAVDPNVEPAWAVACAAALRQARVRVEVVQETDTKVALLGLVASGLGIAIVSASMRQLSRPGVVFRDIQGFDVRVPLVGLIPHGASARAERLMAQAIAQAKNSESLTGRRSRN